ncbi:ATP-dependent zinc metalloprotease YME1L1-like [Brachionichthys hirsutus]|uniref:ATP-dependent zinc metalloprotease YME1L1-like n=1 Tax=Brachionichthys hirsutus TaxID=412623 RepID=UPI0036048ED2
MFSLPVQPQVTVPLSHFINVLHSLRSSGGAVAAPPPWRGEARSSATRRYCPQAAWSVRELGFSDLGAQSLKELVLPRLHPLEAELQLGGQTSWRTSYISTRSFFYNKNGHSCGSVPVLTPLLSRRYLSPLQSISAELQLWPVWVQTRGFKTLRSKSRRRQPARAESEGVAAPFIKGVDAGRLGSLLKEQKIPEAHRDVFKWGFTEGFRKARATTQHTQDCFRRARLVVLALLLVSIYLLAKLPVMFVIFPTTSGLDYALDPAQRRRVTFEHVKGVDEAKNELQDVVEFLKNPQKFTVLGGKLPKGVLLIGPPGTGKTLLARAVAGEADVPFFCASASEFDELLVGVGASRIRSLFREAKANTPCVVFIDELDSVGGKRAESSIHPYSRQTINQLLAELDGFKPNEGVIIIGATNLPDTLDHALIRPGRFDMQVTIAKPDVKGRTEILNWYLKKIKVDPAIEANVIARGTVGFSGADLENLVNQAALKAAVDGKDVVTMKELEFAKDKILMGPERRSVEMDKKNKLITAYHESGHAVVAAFTKDAMPINKATIVPRGSSLGHVSMLPEGDRWSESRAQLLARMDVSMGGRVGEELVFGHDNITTGASKDFDNATAIAEMMVTRLGMSGKLGVMTYADMAAQSPETQAAVEQEVRLLLKESYERAKALLKSHAKEHKGVADALITYETLDGKEIQLVLEGKTPETR